MTEKWQKQKKILNLTLTFDLDLEKNNFPQTRAKGLNMLLELDWAPSCSPNPSLVIFYYILF